MPASAISLNGLWQTWGIDLMYLAQYFCQILRNLGSVPEKLRRRDWREHLNNAHYGKGWRVYDFNGKELIYHAGWVAGYVAEVAYSPELNVGMAILLNGESRVIAELGSQFWSDVFEQYEKSHKG